VNYTADFLWLSRCQGELASSLRLRGAALKAFAEVGTSAAVRAVLQRASRPDAEAMRIELQGHAGPANFAQELATQHSEIALLVVQLREERMLFIAQHQAALQQMSTVVQAALQQQALVVQDGVCDRLKDFLRQNGEALSVRTANFAQRVLRDGMQACLRDAVAEARSSGVIEITRQGGGEHSSQEQVRLMKSCRQLPAGEEAQRVLQEDGHLPVTNFLENTLPHAQHYVIVHFMPKFAEELKRRKLEQAAALNEKPWISWSVGAWRIQYMERDRGLMEALFHEVEWQEKLRSQLERHMPAELPSGSRGSATGSFRPGPYSRSRTERGSSANMSLSVLGRFFGRSAASAPVAEQADSPEGL